jgi:PIN domain nuclease of toxin-antitoxin system
VRVLADSQALVWYLADPGRLSEAALAALDDAEASDGIAVCAVTTPELWLATHKRSESRRLKPGVFELVKATIANPELNFGVVAVTAATAGYFEAVPWPALRDPFDRFIVATSLALGLPLVSADEAIRGSAGDVVIW